MPSSSIAIYQQQALKLFSHRNVLLGIPLAAGSVILFLQWRKRKNLRPKSRPRPKEVDAKDVKFLDQPSQPENAQTAPAASGDEAPNSADVAPPPISFIPPNHHATVSPIRHTKPTHGRPASPHEEPQFAYAKRPRLGRGRSSEKFGSYSSLRTLSGEGEVKTATVSATKAVPAPEKTSIIIPAAESAVLETTTPIENGRRQSIQVDTIVQVTYEPSRAPFEPTMETTVEASESLPVELLSPMDPMENGRRPSIQVDTIVEMTYEPLDSAFKPVVVTTVEASENSPIQMLAPIQYERRPSIQVDTTVEMTYETSPASAFQPTVETTVQALLGSTIQSPVDEPAAAPAEELVSSPFFAPISYSVDAPAEEPVSAPLFAPISYSVDVPAEEPVSAPFSETIFYAVDAPVEEPASTPSFAPISYTVDAPIEEPLKTPAQPFSPNDGPRFDSPFSRLPNGVHDTEPGSAPAPAPTDSAPLAHLPGMGIPNRA